MQGSRSLRRGIVSAVLARLVLPAVAWSGAGDLDPSFGTNGVVITALTTAEDRANAVALQPDGKIVAAGGYFPVQGEVDFAVVRYLSSGVLDPGFGTGGFVRTDIPGNGEASSVVVQPDGKIVALGASYDGTQYDSVLARYDASGTLDSTFGSGGIVVSGLGPGAGFPWQVLLQPDGKLLTVGEYRDGGFPTAWALARFNPDGTPDTSFGAGGEVFTDLAPGYDAGKAAVLQPDGRIVMFGTSGFQFALVRYEVDGTVDATFGVGGIALMPAMYSYPSAVALQPDGKIVAAGDGGTGDPTYSFEVTRANPDGTVDASFGTGGMVKTDVGPANDYALDVTVAPDGKILVVGQVEQNGFFTSSFGVVRYLPSGAPDPGFGTGGIATTSFGALSYAIAEPWPCSPTVASCSPPRGRISVRGTSRSRATSAATAATASSSRASSATTATPRTATAARRAVRSIPPARRARATATRARTTAATAPARAATRRSRARSARRASRRPDASRRRAPAASASSPAGGRRSR